MNKKTLLFSFLSLILIGILIVSLYYFAFIPYQTYQEELKEKQKTEQERKKNEEELEKLLKKVKKSETLELIDIYKKAIKNPQYRYGMLEKEILKSIENYSEEKEIYEILVFLAENRKYFEKYKEFPRVYLHISRKDFLQTNNLNRTKRGIAYEGKLLDRIMKIRELSEEEYRHMFLIFFSLKRYKDTEKETRKMIKKYPQKAEYYGNYSRLKWFTTKNKWEFQEELFGYYKKAIELDPKNPRYYQDASLFLAENIDAILSNYLTENGEISFYSPIWKEVKKKYGNLSFYYAQKAVDLDPKNPYSNYLLSQMYYRAEEPTYNYFDQTGVITPSDIFVDNKGNYDKSFKYAKKAFELSSGLDIYALNLINLAQIFGQKKYSKEVLDIGITFLNKYPKNRLVLNKITVLLLQNPTNENLKIALNLMKRGDNLEDKYFIYTEKEFFKNYLKVASLLKEKEIIRDLLKRINKNLYESFTLYDMNELGLAFEAIGEKELGKTLRGAYILVSYYSTNMSARQKLAEHGIYIKRENLNIIQPLYGNNRGDYHKYRKKEDFVIKKLRVKIQEAIKSFPSTLEQNIFEKTWDEIS